MIGSNFHFGYSKYRVLCFLAVRKSLDWKLHRIGIYYT